jgi:hypothetical protein
LGLGQYFDIQYDKIVTPSNGVILFQGMADHTAESIKSLEGFDIAYIEEAQTITARSLELLRPTIRGSIRMKERKRKSEIWASWNPRNSADPIDAFLRGPNPPPDAIVVESNWRDNPWFPEELKEEREYDLIHAPQRYGHIWEGEYEPQAIGAIWTRDVIERNRVKDNPELTRILIGVDPPGESKTTSDKCGLIAGGIDEKGHGYVLQDESKQASPEEWGRAAVAMYDLHEADAIVVEVNQGGDMVRSVLHSIRPNIKVIKVRAKRGKHLRAEPISSMYALNKIHHVGNFPDLERQMCLTTADGYDGSDSPDNMDSMVYVFLELFNKMIKEPRSKKPQPGKAASKYNPHRWRGNGR